jgi:hypothetical protein
MWQNVCERSENIGVEKASSSRNRDFAASEEKRIRPVSESTRRY